MENEKNESRMLAYTLATEIAIGDLNQVTGRTNVSGTRICTNIITSGGQDVMADEILD